MKEKSEEFKLIAWEELRNNATRLMQTRFTGLVALQNVLEHYSSQRRASDDSFLPKISTLLRDFERCQIEARIESKLTSCDFNPLYFFRITETVHSKILAYLLDPEESHGQGHLFLYAFFDLIEFKDRRGRWIVTAEQGRVDVLIKRTAGDNLPHAAILIENKCHDAKDQQNQLYRYWYQEIYWPNRYSNPSGDEPYNPELYRIYYIPEDGDKFPAQHSTERCPTLASQNENLPLTMPGQRLDELLRFLTFRSHIVSWIRDCSFKIETTNTRLKEFLNQYVELWTN